MAPKRQPRRERRDTGKRMKKKISVLNLESIDYVDYKDVDLLKKFISERGKIRSRRVTGNNAQQQRAVAVAVKTARELALLPYSVRIATGARGAKKRPRRDEEAPEAEVTAAEAYEIPEAEGYEAESVGGDLGDGEGEEV